MPKVEILIQDISCPTWNDISKLHWTGRRQFMMGIKGLTINRVKSQLKGEIRRLAEQLPQPCHLTIKASFRKRKGLTRRDPDNLYVKPFVDGLVHAGLLKDDNSRCVAAVTLMVEINQEKDSIIITLS